MDFTGSKGTIIALQNISYLELNNCKLSNVKFTGSINDLKISKCDFTGSSGVMINPQNISIGGDLTGCKFAGVKFRGSFRYTKIKGSDFTGSTGAIIEPQEIVDKDLSDCKFAGVTFLGSFNECNIKGSNFTGSRGAIINPKKLYYYNYSHPEESYNCNLSNTVFTDARFIRAIEGKITGADFTGSKGAKINPQAITDKDLSNTKLADVTFTGSFDGCKIGGADFTGSTGAKIDIETVVNDNLDKTNFTDAQVIGELTTYTADDFCKTLTKTLKPKKHL